MPDEVRSPNGSTTPTYSGPTSTQAEKAVAFAYAQLGCPYVYGATGPCHSGFDCSGLAQAAWAYAGVAIPRDSYEQWAGLPHVSVSSIEPGDLLIYDGEGHVAIYVGGGYIIDAPRTGMDVEKIPMSRQPRRGRPPLSAAPRCRPYVPHRQVAEVCPRRRPYTLVRCAAR